MTYYAGGWNQLEDVEIVFSLVFEIFGISQLLENVKISYWLFVVISTIILNFPMMENFEKLRKLDDFMLCYKLAASACILENIVR